MRLLLITNLYPPQELGGYGRCMADFSWGLLQRKHQVQVICSDAPYLGNGGNGPNGEPVSRCLQLKGSFESGVNLEQNPQRCHAINLANAAQLGHWLSQGRWDGVLLGNLDLLGAELLPVLLEGNIPVLHHIGFVSPPYAPAQQPRSPHYRLVAASEAVREGLRSSGFAAAAAPVVYPGARVELFGWGATGQPLPAAANGSTTFPLKVCFAGLLMGSKGAHTLVQALIQLNQEGINIQANLAGDSFQAGYREQLESMLAGAALHGVVRFVGQLSRPQLARFFRLHHACVFPSIYPEAFGIVGAEAMASGLALVSSGVGGAGELIETEISGLSFKPGDSQSLAKALRRLVQEPALMSRLSQAGEQRVRQRFSVTAAAAELERLFRQTSDQIPSITAACRGKVFF